MGCEREAWWQRKSHLKTLRAHFLLLKSEHKHFERAIKIRPQGHGVKSKSWALAALEAPQGSGDHVIDGLNRGAFERKEILEHIRGH